MTNLVLHSVHVFFDVVESIEGVFERICKEVVVSEHAASEATHVRESEELVLILNFHSFCLLDKYSSS